MNILMVSHYLPPAYSGAGAQALSLAQAVAKRGHNVTVLTSRFGGGDSNESVGSVQICRVGPRMESRLGHARFYMAVARSLLFLAQRADVIHVHGVFWPAVAAAVVARLSGTPMIVKCTRDGDDDPATLRRLREHGLLGRMRHLPINASHAVVAINRAMESSAILEVGASRTVYMPNAVDTEWFRPPEPSEKAHARATLSLGVEPVVLCPAGFISHKGLHTLVQAVSEGSFSATDVLIVGATDPTNPEVDASLAQRVASSKEELSGVRFITMGLVGRVQMRQCYWAADIFVLPSEREGHPNTLLEAMACGLPCVATEISGVREMGLPDLAVTLVPPLDAQSLHEALTSRFAAIGDGAGESARAHIMDGYSMITLGAAYESLYRRVIAATSDQGAVMSCGASSNSTNGETNE